MVTDTFSGAVGVDLPVYAPSNWATAAGAADCLECDGLGNARASTVTNDNAARWIADSFAPSQWSETVVSATGAGSGGGKVGVAVRCSSSGNLYGAYGNTSTLEIFEMNAGAWTQLGSSITLSEASGVPYTIKMTAESTTLVIEVDGAVVGTRTDASHSAGTCGVAAWQGTGTNLIQDWTADSFTPAWPYPVAAGTLTALASGNTIQPVIPAVAEAGDFMTVTYAGNVSRTFTTPTGWTSLGTPLNNANLSVARFYKFHDGSETNPLTTASAAAGSTAGHYGRVYVWKNVDPTTPLGNIVEATSATGSATSTPQSSTVSVDVANSTVVVDVVIDDDNTWSSGWPPGDWMPTELVSSTTGGDIAFTGIYKGHDTTGTITGQTVGTMSASDHWQTSTFVLLPPGGGGPGPVTLAGYWGMNACVN